MSVNNNEMLMAAAGNAAGKLHVDDVFSTYLYTGNGSTQTITNGIDLAGEGGLVWKKQRTANSAGNTYRIRNLLVDSARGVGNVLVTDGTEAQIAIDAVSSFNSDGYTAGTSLAVSMSGDSNVSWTFRKSPKFFDVVTYTGDGVAGRQIPHNLGVEPGMIVVKRLDAVVAWQIYHRSLGSSYWLDFSTSSAIGPSANGWNNTSPDQGSFTIGVNQNTTGGQYVVYLWAHDPDPDEGIIQCGSYTTDSMGRATVDLGWEPQYLLTKATSQSETWYVHDVMRGMPNKPAAGVMLYPNLSNAEASSNKYQPFQTGFVSDGTLANTTYIYLAIRRPNKPPESGTEVYNAVARTGTNTTTSTAGVGFSPDLVVIKSRSLGYGAPVFHDRLRGAPVKLDSSSTAAEVTSSPFVSVDQNGYTLSADAEGSWNQGSATYVDSVFKRTPGFFDVVCYTGDGVAGRTVNHNLGVAPEMMIIKRRDASGNWAVWYGGVDSWNLLNGTSATQIGADFWNSSLPSASVISLGTNANVNSTSATYVAYLFATLPGISKVGSYTGNGSSQTIDCGFTTGARFILIKRTDSTGDWYVWDIARGIVAANDPHLSLNTTAAEVTTDDSLDPAASGFIVNQNTATNINVNSGSYIFLAIA